MIKTDFFQINVLQENQITQSICKPTDTNGQTSYSMIRVLKAWFTYTSQPRIHFHVNLTQEQLELKSNL